MVLANKDKMDQLTATITAFNKMYKLPVADAPSTLLGGCYSVRDKNPKQTEAMRIGTRIQGFMATMLDEVKEGEDIIHEVEADFAPLDALTDLSDWLGDMIIYCLSEAAKFGLPMPEILQIIMESNMSKLGADGKPIYDSNGKVLKGPGYWKPEPKIKELLERKMLERKMVESADKIMKGIDDGDS